MGDGIDPELLSGIVTSITALIIIWLKSSMDNKMSELREVLTNINTNLNNININLISQSQNQNVDIKVGPQLSEIKQALSNIDKNLNNINVEFNVGRDEMIYRPSERIIAEKQPIEVEEEEEEE